MPSVLSGNSTYDRVAEAFPVPAYLLPPSVGLDISDTSIKWLSLEKSKKGLAVKAFGSHSIQSGIVVNGVIKDGDALIKELMQIKRFFGGTSFVHAALPEEIAYIFSMQVPRSIPREEIIKLVEFEFEGRVPISPEQAVYDYDVISDRPKNGTREIGVTAFPKDAAEMYANALTAAGLTPVSLEIEARSIARAITPRKGPDDIALLVDFGRARTGFALIKRGIPVFTTTVNVGGDTLTQAITAELGISEKDAEEYKNEKGILEHGKGRDKALSTMQRTVGALSDEIARHFHYWDTRRNAEGERMAQVEKVVLVGGNANIKGLTDFIAQTVHAETHRGNVWENVCQFEEYIPPITIHQSLEYATAIGLALRGV